jgi:hypothetical protein
LIRDFLKSNPELARQFSAQCLFELMLRIYLRYPLRMAYLKMFLQCRAVPSLADLLLIARVFRDNRNRSLSQRLARNDNALLRT